MDTNESLEPEYFIQCPKPYEENRSKTVKDGIYWELVFLKQKLSTFVR